MVNQRQIEIGFIMYSSDYGDIPTNSLAGSAPILKKCNPDCSDRFARIAAC